MQGLRLLISASPDYMIPNHLRPDKKTQEFIVKAINFLGFEPFDKPIHRYTWEEFRQISEMYRTAKKEMSPYQRALSRGQDKIGKRYCQLHHSTAMVERQEGGELSETYQSETQEL